eukprot:g35210.t1
MICQYPSMDPLNCSVVLSMEMMRLLILQWMDRVKLQCHAVMVIRRYCLLLFFNRYFIYSVMLKMVFRGDDAFSFNRCESYCRVILFHGHPEIKFPSTILQLMMPMSSVFHS